MEISIAVPSAQADLPSERHHCPAISAIMSDESSETDDDESKSTCTENSTDSGDTLRPSPTQASQLTFHTDSSQSTLHIEETTPDDKVPTLSHADQDTLEEIDLLLYNIEPSGIDDSGYDDLYGEQSAEDKAAERSRRKNSVQYCLEKLAGISQGASTRGKSTDPAKFVHGPVAMESGKGYLTVQDLWSRALALQEQLAFVPGDPHTHEKETLLEPEPAAEEC